MLTLIPVEDRAKYIPIVKIKPETGNCNAYMTAKSAARSLTCDEAKAKSYSQKIIEASLSGEMFLGHYWRRGELLIAPEGYINGQSLVGREINGYVVRKDSGRVLPTGERLFVCECTKCGAVRVFNEHALSFGVMPKCGCASSFDLLDRSEPIQRPLEVEDIREQIVSSRKKVEAGDTKHEEAQKKHASDNKQDIVVDWVKYFTEAKIYVTNRRVLKYSEDGGTYLGEYDNSRLAYLDVYVLSAVEAGKPVNPQGYKFIEQCCRGRGNVVTAFGYRWVYADSTEEEKRMLLSRQRGKGGRKNIFQFHLGSRKFITRYDSALTAYCALHPDQAKTLTKGELQKLAKGILDCCRHLTDSFEGFLWMFADEYATLIVKETNDIDDAVNRIAETIDETLGEEPAAPRCEEKVE